MSVHVREPVGIRLIDPPLRSEFVSVRSKDLRVSVLHPTVDANDGLLNVTMSVAKHQHISRRFRFLVKLREKVPTHACLEVEAGNS